MLFGIYLPSSNVCSGIKDHSENEICEKTKKVQPNKKKKMVARPRGFFLPLDHEKNRESGRYAIN